MKPSSKPKTSPTTQGRTLRQPSLPRRAATLLVSIDKPGAAIDLISVLLWRDLSRLLRLLANRDWFALVNLLEAKLSDATGPYREAIAAAIKAKLDADLAGNFALQNRYGGEKARALRSVLAELKAAALVKAL